MDISNLAWSEIKEEKFDNFSDREIYEIVGNHLESNLEKSQKIFEIFLFRIKKIKSWDQKILKMINNKYYNVLKKISFYNEEDLLREIELQIWIVFKNQFFDPNKSQFITFIWQCIKNRANVSIRNVFNNEFPKGAKYNINLSESDIFMGTVKVKERFPILNSFICLDTPLENGKRIIDIFYDTDNESMDISEKEMLSRINELLEQKLTPRELFIFIEGYINKRKVDRAVNNKYVVNDINPNHILKIKDIAKKLGISSAAISQIKKRIINPKLKSIKEIIFQEFSLA